MAGRWVKGQSGNPKGGASSRTLAATYRAMLAESANDIFQVLIKQALAGDTSAAKLIIERVLPPLRPVDQINPFDIGEGTVKDRLKRVSLAIGQGDLSIGDGLRLMKILEMELWVRGGYTQTLNIKELSEEELTRMLLTIKEEEEVTDET